MRGTSAWWSATADFGTCGTSAVVVYLPERGSEMVGVLTLDGDYYTESRAGPGVP